MQQAPSHPFRTPTLTPVASDDSSFVNGTDFMVDGGLVACYVTAEGETKVAGPQGFVTQPQY